MGKMATTKTKSNIDTLRWGSSVALTDKPEGIQNKSFAQAAPSGAEKSGPITQNIVGTKQLPQQQPIAQKLTPTPKASPLDERVAAISQEVRGISSLDELRAYYEAFTHVQLRNTATQLVFGEGIAYNPTAMVIGEAPGADEDIQGKPFVGKSGQLLDKILASIKLARGTNLYISNVIPWRPPGNRTPTEEEIRLFIPLIFRHIELVNPKFLILAGAVSIRAILGNVGGISRIRGRAQDVETLHEKKRLKAMPIYHPSYLLRSPGQKIKAWEDMLQIKLQLLCD